MKNIRCRQVWNSLVIYSCQCEIISHLEIWHDELQVFYSCTLPINFTCMKSQWHILPVTYISFTALYSPTAKMRFIAVVQKYGRPISMTPIMKKHQTTTPISCNGYLDTILDIAESSQGVLRKYSCMLHSSSRSFAIMVL